MRLLFSHIPPHFRKRSKDNQNPNLSKNFNRRVLVSRHTGRKTPFGPQMEFCHYLRLITMRIEHHLSFKNSVDIGKIEERERGAGQRDADHDPKGEF